jgi:N-acetylmuramoyl-L-alanine amidase
MPAAMLPEQRRVTELFYLAFVLWREARAEPKDGKIALVHSIMNRVAHPKWWGASISEVVTKPWQYSSMTDPHDPQLIKYPGIDDAWIECMDVAMGVYDGRYPNPIPTADSYYATSMDDAGNPPKWASSASVKFVGQIGHHKFYDTDGEHPENVKV